MAASIPSRPVLKTAFPAYRKAGKTAGLKVRTKGKSFIVVLESEIHVVLETLNDKLCFPQSLAASQFLFFRVPQVVQK